MQASERYKNLYPIQDLGFNSLLLNECITVLNSNSETAILPNDYGATKLARFAFHANICNIIANWRDRVIPLEPLTSMNAKAIMDRYRVPIKEHMPDLLVGIDPEIDDENTVDINGIETVFKTMEVTITFGNPSIAWARKAIKGYDLLFVIGPDIVGFNQEKLGPHDGFAIYTNANDVLMLSPAEVELINKSSANLFGLLAQRWGNVEEINRVIDSTLGAFAYDPFETVGMNVNIGYNRADIEFWQEELAKKVPDLQDVQLADVTPNIDNKMWSIGDEEEINIKFKVQKNEENYLHSFANPFMPYHITTRERIFEIGPTNWMPMEVLHCGRNWDTHIAKEEEITDVPALMKDKAREILSVLKDASITADPYDMWSTQTTTAAKSFGGIGMKPGPEKGWYDITNTSEKVQGFIDFKVKEYKEDSTGDSMTIEAMMSTDWFWETPHPDLKYDEWPDSPDIGLWDQVGLDANQSGRELGTFWSKSFLGHWYRAVSYAAERMIQNLNYRVVRPNKNRVQLMVHPMWSGGKSKDDKVILFGYVLVAKTGGHATFATSVYWSWKTTEIPIPYASSNYCIVKCSGGTLYFCTYPIQQERLQYYLIHNYPIFLAMCHVDTEIYLMMKKENLSYRQAFLKLMSLNNGKCWPLRSIIATSVLYRICPTNFQQEMCSISTILLSAKCMQKAGTKGMCFDPAMLTKKFYGAFGPGAEYMFKWVANMFGKPFKESWTHNQEVVNTIYMDNCRFETPVTGPPGKWVDNHDGTMSPPDDNGSKSGSSNYTNNLAILEDYNPGKG